MSSSERALASAMRVGVGGVLATCRPGCRLQSRCLALLRPALAGTPSAAPAGLALPAPGGSLGVLALLCLASSSGLAGAVLLVPLGDQVEVAGALDPLDPGLAGLLRVGRQVVGGRVVRRLGRMVGVAAVGEAGRGSG